MKRKLFSTLLCAFALLLLMGAGVEPDSAAALVPEEESAAQTALDAGFDAGDHTKAEAKKDVQRPNRITGPVVRPVDDDEEDELIDAYKLTEPIKNATKHEAETVPQPEPPRKEGSKPESGTAAENLDAGFLIDGQCVPEDTDRTFINGVTYVALAPTVKAMYPDAQVNWDSSSRTAVVVTPSLKLTAADGQFYAVANGRYLYAQDGIIMKDNRLMIPLRILTEAFGATHTWDSVTDTVNVVRGSGTLLPGEAFYNQEDLFWLSRVIYAESGNQPLKGKMAVGNVVLNRVASPIFPNSIHEVLAQRNQFTTYRGGKLANRTPNEQSVIAAKLVLDGGVVEETRGALYFDSLTRSWASGHKVCLGKIGGHTFYR